MGYEYTDVSKIGSRKYTEWVELVKNRYIIPEKKDYLVMFLFSLLMALPLLHNRTSSEHKIFAWMKEKRYPIQIKKDSAFKNAQLLDYFINF